MGVVGVGVGGGGGGGGFDVNASMLSTTLNDTSQQHHHQQQPQYQREYTVRGRGRDCLVHSLHTCLTHPTPASTHSTGTHPPGVYPTTISTQPSSSSSSMIDASTIEAALIDECGDSDGGGFLLDDTLTTVAPTLPLSSTPTTPTRGTSSAPGQTYNHLHPPTTPTHTAINSPTHPPSHPNRALAGLSTIPKKAPSRHLPRDPQGSPATPTPTATATPAVLYNQQGPILPGDVTPLPLTFTYTLPDDPPLTLSSHAPYQEPPSCSLKPSLTFAQRVGSTTTI